MQWVASSMVVIMICFGNDVLTLNSIVAILDVTQLRPAVVMVMFIVSVPTDPGKSAN